MVQEIIYTSAQKGLKQGSRGFCTVVSTSGMAANMAERLESMSGYRHAFPINDPKSALNPVNYAHVTTRMAGQKLNVISRVADAGQDYSGRTNKLAHHIVIDDVSALLAGPARVLADPQVITTVWDGKLATRPPRTLSGADIPETVSLSAWKSVTGDGGWCGYVAEQLLGGRAAVNVLFPAGTDTLALVCEVLDVIPIPQRWGITFSTYFTRLQAGTECQLRFILDGTNESASLRNDARAIRVDLATALPEATGGPLVDQARSGTLQFKMHAAPATARPVQRKTVSDAELEGLLDAERTTSSDGQPKALPAMASASIPPPVSRLNQAFEQKAPSSGKWLVAVLASLLICAIGGGAFYVVPKTLTYAEQQRQLADAAINTNAADVVPKEKIDKQNKPVVAGLPFEGRSPFENVGDTWGGSFPNFQLKLESIQEGAKSAAATLLLEDLEKLSFTAKNVKLVIKRNDTGDQDASHSVFLNGQAVGKFVAGRKADNTCTLYWQADDRSIRDDDFRAAVYSLAAETIEIAAPSNTDEGDKEKISLSFDLPELFNGARPLSEFVTSTSDPVGWNANTPVAFNNYNPRSISWAIGEENSALKCESKPQMEGWHIKLDDCIIASVLPEKLEDGRVQLTWQFSQDENDVITSARGRYLLAKTRLSVKSERADRAEVDEVVVVLDFPAPSPFVDHGKQNEEPGLFELPNPATKYRRKEASIVMRLADPNSVKLTLYPGFEDLTVDKGRTLKLNVGRNVTDKLRTWDVVVSDASTDAQLGTYTLKATTPEYDEYTLSFEWIGSDCEAYGEWLRWCPLTIEVNGEERRYLQREAERWVIPELATLHQTILTIDPAADNLHVSGQEFHELMIPASAQTVVSLALRSANAEPQTFTKLFCEQEPESLSYELYFAMPSKESPQIVFQPTIEHLADQPMYGILKFEFDLEMGITADGKSRERPEIKMSSLINLQLPLATDAIQKTFPALPLPQERTEEFLQEWEAWTQRIDSSPITYLGEVHINAAAKRQLDKHESVFLDLQKAWITWDEWISSTLISVEATVKATVEPTPAQNKRKQLLQKSQVLIGSLGSKLRLTGGQRPYRDAKKNLDALDVCLKSVDVDLRLTYAMGTDAPITIVFIDAKSVNDPREPAQ